VLTLDAWWGEFYALSIDFNHAQLEQILAKADPRLAAYVRTEISQDPAFPRSIDFEGHKLANRRARKSASEGGVQYPKGGQRHPLEGIPADKTRGVFSGKIRQISPDFDAYQVFVPHLREFEYRGRCPGACSLADDRFI
jgi:hypothetical protein